MATVIALFAALRTEGIFKFTNTKGSTMKRKANSALVEYKKGLHDGLVLAIDTITGASGSKADVLTMLQAYVLGAVAGVEEATENGLFDNPLMCQTCGSQNTRARPFMSVAGDDRLICSECYKQGG